jgi:hypothetical protein
MASRKFKKDNDDDGSGIIITPNTNPVLTSELLPGFTMLTSQIHRDNTNGEEVVEEHWCNHPIGESTMKINLYHFKSHKEALQFAEKVFRAKTVKDQKILVGKPFLGSFSGKPIGDICWSYRFPPPEPSRSNDSRALLFIEDCNLVYLHIGDIAKEVPISLAEEVALKIVSKLR